MINLINILHLSDLHFGTELLKGNNETLFAKRNNTINQIISLFDNLEKKWMPDIIVISGDLAWSGREVDYNLTYEWIKKLLQQLNLTEKDLIFCPGNHDINRSKTTGFFRPTNFIEADSCLEIEHIMNLIIPFEDFNNFCKKLCLPELKIGDKNFYLMGQREIKGINFIILNSSWFSRDDNDKDKLYIGLPHLEILKHNSQLLDADGYNSEKISISILHHPYEYLAPDEIHNNTNRKNTYQFLASHSHIIFSGHTHNQSIVPPDRKFNKSLVFINGATYSNNDYWNNFSILQINTTDRKINRKSFEYDPREGKWKEVPDLNTYFLSPENFTDNLIDDTYFSDKFDYSSINTINKFLFKVEIALRKSNFKNENISKIQTIINELLSNSIYYGCKESDGKKVQATIEIQNEKVVITIKDDGVGFDYNKELNKSYNSIANIHGIQLCKQLANQLEYSENGRMVKAVVNNSSNLFNRNQKINKKSKFRRKSFENEYGNRLEINSEENNDIIIITFTGYVTMTFLKYSQYLKEINDFIEEVLSGNHHNVIINLDSHYLDSSIIRFIGRIANLLKEQKRELALVIGHSHIQIFRNFFSKEINVFNSIEDSLEYFKNK